MADSVVIIFPFASAAGSLFWFQLFLTALARFLLSLSLVAASFRKVVPQWQPDPDVEYILR
jgi:hypothetical protein